MNKKPLKKPAPKAGTSKHAAEARRRIFALAYLRNGGNGTHAAIAAGFAPHSAGVTGSKLLKEPMVRAFMEANRKDYQAIVGLETARTLTEVARLAYFDPRRTLDASGQPIPTHLLDDDTAACLASEKSAMVGGTSVGTLERKFYDKGQALDKAMRFHGLYEQDNKQKQAVDVTVNFVGRK